MRITAGINVSNSFVIRMASASTELRTFYNYPAGSLLITSVHVRKSPRSPDCCEPGQYMLFCFMETERVVVRNDLLGAQPPWLCRLSGNFPFRRCRLGDLCCDYKWPQQV